MNRKIFFAVFVFFILLLSVFVYNFYRLDKETTDLYNLMVDQTAEQVQSLAVASLENGTDPVESISAYLQDSEFLSGGAFLLSERWILIPGSKLPDNVTVKKIKAGDLSFKLYFNKNYLYEFKKHIWLESIASSTLILLLALLIIVIIVLNNKRENIKREKMERLNRERELLEATQTATSMIIHEVRNSLNLINLIIYKLKKDVGDSTYLKELADEIRKLNESIENSRDIRKQFQPNLEKVELSGFIEEVIKRFEPVFKRNNISFYFEKIEVYVNIDRELFKKALINLINNSIEALEEKKDKKIIKIIMSSENDRLLLTVEDNSEIIPDGDPFKAYYSTKERGMGLGLFITKKIVTSHDGIIKYNRIDNLTQFTIVLPIAR